MNIQLLLKQAKLTTDVKGRFLTYLTLNLIVNTAYSSADKRVGLLLVRAVLDFRAVASESNTATSYEQLITAHNGVSKFAATLVYRAPAKWHMVAIGMGYGTECTNKKLH